MHSNILILATALACMVYCHMVARKRGLKPPFWGAMGLLFGPLAILFLHLSGPRKPDAEG